MYIYIVDTNLSFIQVRNNIDKKVTILRIIRLCIVIEYKAEGAFIVNSFTALLASNIPRRKN